MRLDDITRTAARLQHAIDAFDANEPFDHECEAMITELRLAAVEHATRVAELLTMARFALGNPQEAQVLAELVDLLIARTGEMRTALRDAPPGQALACTAAVIEELFGWERSLICRCGTILFPAEAG